MPSYYKMRNDLHDEWFGKYPQYLLWWCDLMHRASWKPSNVMVGASLISLHRGQLIASIHDLVKRWRRSKDMIIRFLKILDEKGLITKTTSKNITIITIVDYDLQDDTDNLADNPERVQSADKQRHSEKSDGMQTDNLVDNLYNTDNLADNPTDNLQAVKTDNLVDNLEHVQSADRQRYSEKSDSMQTDNLTDNLQVVKTDNPVDNLADSHIIYTEERSKISTTAMSANRGKEHAKESTAGSDGRSAGNSSAIETSVGIRQLLTDKKNLLLLQRESKFSAEEVKSWIIQFGRKWEVEQPFHNDYQHIIKHVLDTLNIKNKKREKPPRLYVTNESTAKDIWNIVQAELCLQYPDGASILEELLFFRFNDNVVALKAPSVEIKKKVDEKYIALIKEYYKKYSTSPIEIKCGTKKTSDNNQKYN